MHTAGTAEPLEAFGTLRPLNEMEQALLTVLDDEFISTSVVRDRARLKVLETSPTVSRRMLSRALPLATALSAFYELERRGLAERIVIAGCVRWRRAHEAGDPGGAQPRV
ncbi:hypothetical protein ACRAWG_31185 [Methylobacterium sp. P31]